MNLLGLIVDATRRLALAQRGFPADRFFAWTGGAPEMVLACTVTGLAPVRCCPACGVEVPS